MAWATLMHRPVTYIDPARLAACFGGTITTALCERLGAAERLHDRLSAMIVAFYALKAPLDPGTTAADDRRVALTPPERTGDLVRRAGAIFYAGAIASAVRADDVRRLRAYLGESLYAFALANRDLSGPSRSLVLGPATDVIEEHGLRCLSAWCRSQPEAVGARVRLKSPPSPALDGLDTSVIDIGPAIVRRAAG
jgi:hypothetical protein